MELAAVCESRGGDERVVDQPHSRDLSKRHIWCTLSCIHAISPFLYRSQHLVNIDTESKVQPEKALSLPLGFLLSLIDHCPMRTDWPASW